MPDALPAVTVPSLRNTGRSFARSSAVASARTCSSVSNTVSPRRVFSFTGRICCLNRPSAIARAARRCNSTRQRVLVAAGDLVALRQVLGGLAHVDVVERVVQRGEHHVDHRRIAHARAPAHALREVRRAAHALGAAAHRDVGVAQHDGLRRRHDRLQPRAAQPVQRQRRRLLRHAGVHRGDAREVHVLRLGVDHVAEHHLADLVAGDAGARQRLAHHLGAEFGRRHVLQPAAEIADRGAHAGNDDDLALHVHLSSPAQPDCAMCRCR